MYSEYENMPSDSITAKSLDECRAILFEKFGNSYQITDIKTELKSSFLGFFPKEYVKVKYIIRGKNPSYQDSVKTFEKNKDELLKTLNPSVNTTKQNILRNFLEDIISKNFSIH